MAAIFEPIPEKINGIGLVGRQFLIEVGKQLSEIQKHKHNTSIEGAMNNPKFEAILKQYKATDKIKVYETLHNLIIQYTGTATYLEHKGRDPFIIGKPETDWKKLILEIVNCVDLNKELFTKRMPETLSVDPIVLAAKGLDKALYHIIVKFKSLDKPYFVERKILSEENNKDNTSKEMPIPTYLPARNADLEAEKVKQLRIKIDRFKDKGKISPLHSPQSAG